MATTRISDNQIAEATAATITTLNFLNTNSEFKIPVGNTATRPGTPAVGMMRFNSENDKAEVYVADSDGDGNPGWINLGAGAGGSASVLGDNNNIRGNPKTIAENIEIPNPSTDKSYENAFSLGPTITIATGYAVTVPVGVDWRIFD
tara:strand:- start:2266 stop:2706 length:441 start_codon:yes stop_codon:yes gene_type:complete